jgi:hypothetical protein
MSGSLAYILPIPPIPNKTQKTGIKQSQIPQKYQSLVTALYMQN